MRFSIDNNEAEDRRRRRLIRFATGIDSTLTNAVRDMPEVEAIARLYLAKMRSALETGHPVFRYENLTSNPRAELSAILDAMGLPWDESVLWSEKSYPRGLIGHGGIDLSRPIQTGVPVYAGGLTDEEFETVARITEPILKPLGYSYLVKG